MVTNFTALFDACTLHPALLRDLLLQLGTTGLFRARWTAQIHEEWITSVLRERPQITRPQLERTRDLMDAHAPECVVKGYEGLIPSLKLPDSDDRHILAAAIRARADVIVTFNTKDFPHSQLSSYDIEAQHPDDFLNHLCDLAPQGVCASAAVCRRRLKQPPFPVDQYLAGLSRLRLPQTVTFLTDNRGLL